MSFPSEPARGLAESPGKDLSGPDELSYEDEELFLFKPESEFGVSRRQAGIRIKSLENAPFSSVLYFVAEFKELKVKVGQRSLEGVRLDLEKWGLHLVDKMGLFNWEKDLLLIKSLEKSNIKVTSSFITTMEAGSDLRVIVNYRIGVNLVGAEANHVMIRSLPAAEEALRVNLMLDLAGLIKRGIQDFLDQMKPGNEPVLRDSAMVEEVCKRFKSTLERCLSAGDGPSPCRYIITKFDMPGLLNKGFLLSRDRVPLLWAKKTVGLNSFCSLFEAKDLTEATPLGYVKSNRFGRHTIYEHVQVGTSKYFKEIAAVNYPKLHTNLDDMTLLLPNDPGYEPSPNAWKFEKGVSKFKCLAQKWEAGDVSDLRVFRNDRGRPRSAPGKFPSGKSKMEISDESGTLVLRLEKLKGIQYSLEFKSPFEPFTAFSLFLHSA